MQKDIDIVDFELIHIQSDKEKCVQYPLSHFFKNYNNLSQQDCTDEDLDALMLLDDSALRHKVAACMQNVDENELERQISKPHGALEISDLDIKFFEDSQLKYLCMPFKTGREISRTMDESYMYQLLKPFSHFGDNCFVVLITARKCSQGLETYIQRMSIKQPSWRIDVIQHEQLCKLLKANSQISSQLILKLCATKQKELADIICKLRILYRLRTRNALVLWLYRHKHYIIF